MSYSELNLSGGLGNPERNFDVGEPSYWDVASSPLHSEKKQCLVCVGS